MKTSLHHAFLAVSLATALAACGSTPTAPQTTGVFTLQPTSASTLTVASGISTPITVQVNAPSGSSAAGLPLSATTDARYCTLDRTSATTDANGNATFNLTPGPIGGVTCTTSVTLLSVNSSRGNIAVNTFIRPLQRVLATPSGVALPSVSASVTDAGNAASTVTISALGNVAALDTAHTYGVYLAKTDVNGIANTVTLVGRISSGATFPVTFSGPANLASSGFNTVGLVLQGTAGISNLSGNALLGGFTVAPLGSSSTTLILPQIGVTNPAPYAVAGASAQVSLTSPNAALGVGNDSLSVVWNGLPLSPTGTRYVVYGSDGKTTTRLGNFSATTSTGTFTFNAPVPANTSTPGTTVTDARANYTRVFVTLEPVSASDGAFPSNQPGPTVVLDGALSSWTQSIR